MFAGGALGKKTHAPVQGAAPLKGGRGGPVDNGTQGGHQADGEVLTEGSFEDIIGVSQLRVAPRAAGR